MASVLGTGKMWVKVPQTIKVTVNGKLPENVRSKDIILRLIGDLGADGATYQALEFTGSTIDEMSVASRMTMSNMAIEAGAKCALFTPDEKTAEYCNVELTDELKDLKGDADAVYAREITYNAEDLVPVLACPSQVDTVSYTHLNDMECIYSTGHYKNNVIEAAYVNDDKFVNHFDEYGVNMVNNIASLTIEFPEVFRKLRDNNICSFLQMKADGADGKEYMVEFDIFGTNRRKWSDTDVIMLRMVVLGVVNAISGQLTD